MFGFSAPPKYEDFNPVVWVFLGALERWGRDSQSVYDHVFGVNNFNVPSDTTLQRLVRGEFIEPAKHKDKDIFFITPYGARKVREARSKAHRNRLASGHYWRGVVKNR